MAAGVGGAGHQLVGLELEQAGQQGDGALAGVGDPGLEVGHRHPGDAQPVGQLLLGQAQLGPVLGHPAAQALAHGRRRPDRPTSRFDDRALPTHLADAGRRSTVDQSPMPTRALITGITGQDGSYLAEFLLDRGLRRHRHGAAQLARSPSSASPTSRTGSTLVPGDLLDEVSLIEILRDAPARRGLQPGRPVASCQTSFGQPVLTGEITALGVTRLLDAIRIVDPDDPLLPGLSAARCSARCVEVPQTRDDAVLPPQPLRRGQGLRPLDHGELPRELRPARLLGHPVQPREPPPGPRVRDPQDQPRRGPHQARPRHRAAPGQPRGPARLGLRRRLRAGHVAHAPAGRARRLRGRRPARPTRCASSASWPSATLDLDYQRPRGAGRALLPPGRGRPAGRRRRPGPRGARLGARRPASPSWSP